MAKVYDGIDPDIAAWIQRQPVFFVWRTRDDERIAAYHAEKNATSLDGLAGLSGSSESPVAREDPVAPAGRP